MNTHYAVVVFGGDFDNDHPDPKRRGLGPTLEMVGCGDEAFCWDAARSWTAAHPLGRDETVEVLARDPQVVRNGLERAGHYLAQLRELGAPATELEDELDRQRDDYRGEHEA